MMLSINKDNLNNIFEYSNNFLENYKYYKYLFHTTLSNKKITSIFISQYNKKHLYFLFLPLCFIYLIINFFILLLYFGAFEKYISTSNLLISIFYLLKCNNDSNNKELCIHCIFGNILCFFLIIISMDHILSWTFIDFTPLPNNKNYFSIIKSFCTKVISIFFIILVFEFKKKEDDQYLLKTEKLLPENFDLFYNFLIISIVTTIYVLMIYLIYILYNKDKSIKYLTYELKCIFDQLKNKKIKKFLKNLKMQECVNYPFFNSYDFEIDYCYTCFIDFEIDYCYTCFIDFEK